MRKRCPKTLGIRFVKREMTLTYVIDDPVL
jgi:hypothetical protein